MTVVLVHLDFNRRQAHVIHEGDPIPPATRAALLRLKRP